MDRHTWVSNSICDFLISRYFHLKSRVAQWFIRSLTLVQLGSISGRAKKINSWHHCLIHNCICMTWTWRVSAVDKDLTVSIDIDPQHRVYGSDQGHAYSWENSDEHLMIYLFNSWWWFNWYIFVPMPAIKKFNRSSRFTLKITRRNTQEFHIFPPLKSQETSWRREKYYQYGTV